MADEVGVAETWSQPGSQSGQVYELCGLDTGLEEVENGGFWGVNYKACSDVVGAYQQSCVYGWE